MAATGEEANPLEKDSAKNNAVHLASQAKTGDHSAVFPWMLAAAASLAIILLINNKGIRKKYEKDA